MTTSDREPTKKKTRVMVCVAAPLTSFLAYGLFGTAVGGIPVVVTTFLAVYVVVGGGFSGRVLDGRNLIAAFVGGFTALIVAVIVLLPTLGYASPRTSVINDRLNLRQINMSLMIYSADHGAYPPLISTMIETQHVNPPRTHRGSGSILHSPRGCGRRDIRYDGILQTLWVDFGEYPGHKHTEDIDRCDYLYRPPLKTNPSTIVMTTRPDLLYKRSLNVAYADGRVVSMSAEQWQADANVTTFIARARVYLGSLPQSRQAEQDTSTSPQWVLPR
jgi:hypothetical protein